MKDTREFYRELDEHQKSMIAPEAERFAKLEAETAASKERLLRMLALLEPKVLTAGHGFDIPSMRFYRTKNEVAEPAAAAEPAVKAAEALTES